MFTSDRDEQTEIYIIKSDGTDVRRVTNNNAADEAGSWAPDGIGFTFVSQRSGNQEVFRTKVNLESGASANINPLRRRLTASPSEFDNKPSWSPDSESIAFSSCLLYTSPSPRD